MEKIGWLELDKTSGSSSGTVIVKAEAHTGRLDKEQTLVWVAKGVEGIPDVPRTVKQLGKSEFVNIPNIRYEVSQAGGTLTITGTSNAKTLTFDVINNAINMEVPNVYFIGNTEIDNGKGHPDDPGKANQYEFKLVFNNIPSNSGVEDKIATLKIWGSNTNIIDSCTIVSSASSAILTVTPEIITLNADGGTGEFTITSNIGWEIKGQ